MERRQGDSVMHDMVIRGGQLVDGTGQQPVPGPCSGTGPERRS